MKASDVMVAPVITVKPQDLVKDVASLFLRWAISGAPVVDDQGRLVGMISEGDLLHRAEIGTEQRRSRWLRLFVDDETLASDYIKSHARKVADLMTRNVVSATPDTALHEVATMMDKHAVKRLPIVSNGQLVGLVSRSNLVQAIAISRAKLEIPVADSLIREKLMSHLRTQGWAQTGVMNATVKDGIVDLSGIADSSTHRTAIRVAAETIPGVRAVNDRMILRPLGV